MGQSVFSRLPCRCLRSTNRRGRQGEWQGAKEDLLKAYELETADGKASGILLNNLGNVYGALDDWETAIEKFRAASLEPVMAPIALANLALALFQAPTAYRTSDAILFFCSWREQTRQFARLKQF